MKISIWEYLQFLFFSGEILFVVWMANAAFSRVYGPPGKILEHNVAVAVQRLGFSFGCAMAMFSAMAHVRTAGFFATAGEILLYGAISSVFVLIATMVNDHIITDDVDDNAEIIKGNLSVAIVDASAAIATGFVTAASFSANGNGPWYAPAVFFVLGQVALVASAKLFVRFAGMENAWLRNGNVAAGVSLGGMLIATGITLQNAISGPFVGWIEDLSSLAASYVVGMVVLFSVAAFVPRLFFGNVRQKFSDEIFRDNAAFSLFTATFKIILALAVGMVIP
jgi:uncharacterized membrane protein YjfL (UPF0719 family)